MHSESTLSKQQGAALLLAVVALAAIGAMVAGCFLAGWLEARSAAAARYGVAAFEAAEAGAAETIAEWDPGLSRLPLRTDSVIAAAIGSGLTDYTVTVTRLSPGTFLVRSEGRRRAAGGPALARRLIGVFVRLEAPEVDHGSALTLSGPAMLASADVVDGSDHVPAGWDSLCPSPSDQPPIRTVGGAVTTDSGPPVPVVVDTLIGPPTFTTFGPVTFDELAARAVREVAGSVGPLAPSAANGGCDIGAASNWGEPSTGAGSVAECFGFMPIIHAAGNLSLAGGRGQGVLLVGGDLELSGGTEFAGVVVVLGRVTTSGAGGHVTGTLLVGGTGTSSVGVESRVEYSSCAVFRALAANAGPRRLRERSWAQLY
jgi:hypothetical protein